MRGIWHGKSQSPIIPMMVFQLLAKVKGVLWKILTPYLINSR
jgi:hypothetical protein